MPLLSLLEVELDLDYKLGSDSLSYSSDSEVEIVDFSENLQFQNHHLEQNENDKNKDRVTQKSESNKGIDDEDEDDSVEIVGTKNYVHLPHMRQHCTIHPFLQPPDNSSESSLELSSTMMADTTDNNFKFCKQCYCYVCDVKVGECPLWPTHCHGTDRGPNAKMWTRQRQQVRAQNACKNIIMEKTTSHTP